MKTNAVDANTMRAGKRPYVQPQVLSAESYERLALACTGAGQGNPRSPTPPPAVTCTLKNQPDGNCQNCISS